MKIAYIVSMFPCWSETFILREILELQRQGVNLTILSLKPCSESLVHPEASFLCKQGRVVYASAWRGAIRFVGQLLLHPVQVPRLLAQFARSFRGSRQSLLKSWFSMMLAADFIPLMRARGIHHIHAPWATYPSTAALFCHRLAGFSFSFTGRAHDLFLEDHGLAIKLREAQFVQTITEYNRTLIRQRYPDHALDTLHVIHSALDPSDFVGPRAPVAPDLLLSIGRMVEMKGFAHLIEACALLRDRGMAFQCRIFGEGPLKTSLQEQISQRELSALVQLCEPVPQAEIRRLLTQASCFLLPCVTAGDGDQDGIPNVLMEAMAARVPVISCPTSGVPELVQHEITGMLAAPRSPQSLVEQIERILSDSALRQRIAEAGRLKVEDEFNIHKNAARLASLFPPVASSVGMVVGAAACEADESRGA